MVLGMADVARDKLGIDPRELGIKRITCAGDGREDKELRRVAEELKDIGGDIEAVRRNVERILASVRILELNICDVEDLERDV